MEPMFNRENGKVILGKPTDGCRHCGKVERKETDRAILYHPGVLCCEPACREQIEWRNAEGARLNERWKARFGDLMAQRAKDDSEAWQERITNAIDVERARVHDQADQLKREIADANEALRIMRGVPQPLAYKDA